MSNAEDEDIAKRDAFAARLRERDEQSKRHRGAAPTESASMPVGLTAAQVQELATTGTLKSSTVNNQALEEMREISRAKYLEKREQKELELLELMMKSEQNMFGEDNMSAQERERLELNKKILNLATDKNRFTYKDDGYQMPMGYEDKSGLIDKSKRDNAMMARYEPEERAKTEQEVWEEAQVMKSVGPKKASAGGEYDLLMDDQIDFISVEILKNAMKEKLRAEMKLKKKQKKDKKKKDKHHSRDSYSSSSSSDSDSSDVEEVAVAAEEPKPVAKTAHEKILEGRMKLPVYQFREKFLEMVRDNKVLIVNSHTGSGELAK